MPPTPQETIGGIYTGSTLLYGLFCVPPYLQNVDVINSYTKPFAKIMTVVARLRTMKRCKCHGKHLIEISYGIPVLNVIRNHLLKERTTFWV